MKRLLIVALAIALGLVGSWTAAADPADAPNPDQAPAVETDLADVDSDAADSQGLAPAEPESDTASAELGDGTYGLPSPEAGLRKNNGCVYSRCSHPIMCPNIINLPQPSCINGCCVY